MTTTEIVRVVPDDRYEGMTLAVAPAEAKKRVAELQAFVSSVMVRDQDFGVIPGTDKPSLFQPGAQKLAEIYGLAHRFEPIDQVKDWERGFFYFEYRCIITSRRDGRHICEGIGSCNSKESKYAARWVFDREIPQGLDRKTLKTKQIKSRKNGQTYTMFMVPNEDPFSLVNTIQKMAAKRSYVHAIISATRSAGVFTQDAEDLPAEAFGQPEKERSWEHDEAPPAKTPSTPPPSDSSALGIIYGSQIEQAKDLGALKVVMATIKGAADQQKLTLSQVANLRDAAKAKQKALKAPPKDMAEVFGENVLPEGWGGPPETDAVEETCVVCRKPLGASAAVSTTDADGVVAFRHAGCPAPREPGEEG
jgi:hypothetical protein